MRVIIKSDLVSGFFIESEKIFTTKFVLLTNTVLSFSITSSFLSEMVIALEQPKKEQKNKTKNK